MTTTVKIGDQVFSKEGGTMFGAVRGVSPHALEIYVEGAGDYRVPGEAVVSVHDGKVILELGKLEDSLRKAIASAHKKEEPHT